MGALELEAVSAGAAEPSLSAAGAAAASTASTSSAEPEATGLFVDEWQPTDPHKTMQGSQTNSQTRALFIVVSRLIE
jgi:hypothetical protein